MRKHRWPAQPYFFVLLLGAVALFYLSWSSPTPSPAAGELRFTDITVFAGTGGPTEPGRTGGHAALFTDVDGDGFPDLYITFLFESPMPDRLYMNRGDNTFAEEGQRRGVDDYDGGSHGATFADLDNDGHFDIFNGTTEPDGQNPAINRIYRNNGDGFFTDVTANTGIPVRNWPTRAVVAFDMDGDGDLDLFCVTNYLGSDDPPGERNEVYRNDGNMRFTAINSGALYEAPAGQGATDTDYNGDGRIDIIAANRTGPVNVLRNNGGGNFTLIRGTDIGIDMTSSDGITTADIDNDGDLDMVVVRDGEARLYENLGNGTFRFKQAFNDVDGYMGGFADLDNDGDLDLVFAGDDVAYINDGTGTFTPGPSIDVRGINDPRAIAFADIDNDGDLDFAYGCKRSRNWLVRNDFNSGNWLKIRLVSPQGQAGAFGAKTRIYPAGEAGGTLLGLRESRSNNGYLGQDDPVLHFGLGDRNAVDVVVTFPDGSNTIRRNVTANQTILIAGEGQDRTPPLLFAIAVPERGSDRLRITWETDEPASSQVEFGTSASLGQSTSISTALVTRHSVEITGLQPGTVYHLRLRSRDKAGNLSQSSIFTVRTTGDNRGALDQRGRAWQPLEWRLENPSFSGNPFDLVATATFTHLQSGEKRTTEMFYAGGSTWAFRFTATRPGVWSFTTASAAAALAGKSGSASIDPSPGAPGFVTHTGKKWARSGTNRVFVPQYVMYDDPPAYYDNPGKIDADIQRFLVEHGFNGVHTNIFCRWFDLNEPRSDRIANPVPDFRTFEALELLIEKVYAAGGVVHIWAWGDEERRFTPVRWGLNGEVDRRLQRYIAARLGPLPGWTMGYGFDLDEWVSAVDLQRWHRYMQEKMGWRHLLGARSEGPNNYSPGVNFPQIYDGLDYVSYEQHKPSYEAYVAALAGRPGRPVFSEDRFRMRNEGRSKDYTMVETRRGLWYSAMAGGVANIWGNLLSGDDGTSGSEAYPNPEWIRTNAEFFRARFLAEMTPDAAITDGVSLVQAGRSHFLFYKEDASSLRLDLRSMPAPAPAIAVDTRRNYSEIDLGVLDPSQQTWQAPYQSDWALAVGDFSTTEELDTQAPEIGNVRILHLRDTSVTIRWQTDEPADSQVEYSFDGAYDLRTPLQTRLRTNHGQVLTGLLPQTTYQFRVLSRDSTGNLATSSGFTFTTSNPLAPPDSLQVSEIYPNPFNLEARFHLDLPSAGTLDATVHSLTGAEVVRLHGGFVAAGRHTFTWHGRDASERPVASGIYFLRLRFREDDEAEAITHLRRMTLVK